MREEEIEHIKFQIQKIKQALEIFKSTRADFLKAMDAKSPVNPNRLGRLERILKEYIVIKIAALVDTDKRTFSVKNLKENNIAIILEEFQPMLKTIKDNRDKAFGHHEKEFIMEKEILGDEDLLNLPINDFLNRVEANL